MEDKTQDWYSLLEDSPTWNNADDGTQSSNHFERGPAASTFINSATSHRAALPRFSALTSSCGQIFSPIHDTSKAAVTLPYGTPSKISDYLTEYSITTSDLVANITHKNCDSPPQSNLQCTNTILRSQNISQIVQQRPELRLQQTPKDVHPTKRTLEGLCESKTKTNATRSLVFPFPSDHNLHLQSGKQRQFETSLAGSSSSRTDPTDVLKCQIDVNTESAVRKSFPDLFNPSLPIRVEPAGRDIPESLNQPSSAPPSTDDQENKVPVLNKRHDKLSKTNSGSMNSVVIESASKEQVRYKKTLQRNVRHEELGATPVSSDAGKDAAISSKATGYATTLSTLLDYMTVDERVKLLPPSTLTSNVAPDPGGHSNNRDTVGTSHASTDSGPILAQKGLLYCGKDEHLSTEKRPVLQPPAWSPVNRNITETEDSSMMPPVGNRDNFIPVGSESNIQTIGKGARFFRAVTVGGSSSSLSKKLDANIHITISKGPSSEVDIDNLLPIEERERFLPTGADSESLDKASSSSHSSSTSGSNDDIHESDQVDCVQNQILNESFNPSTEHGLTPPLYQELGVAELLDTKLEGATASCATDAGNILTKKSAEDYMDVVEREKYVKTDLFDACKDLPKNRGQESGFKGNFDRDQDKTNMGKSEPDLLLGHSSNFGICGPDLYPIVTSGENICHEGNAGLSDRKPGFASYSAIPPSITLQEFETHTRPIMLPTQPLPFGDFTCPNEEDEDDTDELINMVSSVCLLEPNNGISPNKSDSEAAGQLQYRSAMGVGDVSSPSDNPHLSQTNLNDNVSTGTSNLLTESGRGTLGSSDVSNSPPNVGDNSKTAEDEKLTSQDISYKTPEPLNIPNATNSKTENIVEIQTLNSSHESLGNSDKSLEIHNRSDKSVKISRVHSSYSETTSRCTDLYLPLRIAVKGSIDNTSDLSSAHSYDNDQSQDSDILGKQVNSLLCRTAYLEYRNQNVRTSMVKTESNVVLDRISRSSTPLVPFAEAYELDTDSNSARSSYTEKEGLNYDQLKQDLTDLQNGLTQGLQLKSPILKDDDIFVGINESINKTGSSENSPDVLQDSRIPTNLFRKTTQQQADLLLGMDRILRKKEDAFESASPVCLPLLAGQQENEVLQKECREGGATQNAIPKHPLPVEVETVSIVPEMVLENKPKRHSQTIQEAAFVYPNQVNDHDNAVPLGSTQGFTRTPHVSDELALRVERILSEEPLYNMSNINFLDRIRPETGFFKKLSFNSDSKSIKTESVSDITETDSAPSELQTSKDSSDKCPSDLIKITGGFENNTEELYFEESVASKESSENFNCSTLSNSSHSIDSSKKERSLGVADFADAQPSRKDITNTGNASDYRSKTGAFDNSSLAFVSSKPASSNLNEETRSPLRFTHKEDVLVEPIHFGHNETLPYPVNESSNSIKFLDEDVRKCLDWSNMSTFSSPPKETVNLLPCAETVENITDDDPECKAINFAPISNISKNDPKRSRNGSISGKSATNSSHSESDCPSLNTVASVHAISAERKLSKSSQLESHLQADENSHQRSDAISTSSSSSSRNQKQKRSTNNISTQRIDLGFSSEDFRQLSKNLTQDDSLKLDDDMHISRKFNNSSQRSPYKLSLSESQPDFHPRNQTPRISSNRSCSDINALLHSEDPTPFLKPRGRRDIDSLRRDLDALSNYEQAGNDFLSPAILEREKPKENGDVSSLPSSKSFPSVSPSMVVSPFETENDPVTAVSQPGDCSKLKKQHGGDSTSVTSQFYESTTSREFVIGKASSSTSSTNPSRTSSAWISSRKSTSKGKMHDASVPIQTDDKLQTSIEVKYPLNQQRETACHIPADESNGIELNYHASKIHQTQTQSERTETKSSSSISLSPSSSEDSVASDKTWTLRPYKPAGSRNWYYTNYCDNLIAGESGTTTLESADTGSDDAIGPPIPKEFLGSRVTVPSRPGIYSRAIHKKNIPIQEDLLLSTIHEKSLVDERDRASRILEKQNSQYLYKTNGYSAKNPTTEPQTFSTKSVPLEFNAKNKDLSGTSQTPQRIEQLASKENISAPPLDPEVSSRPAGIENLTEVLYDDRRPLGTDNIETRREREKYPEKLAVNRSVIDLQTKNTSSFESGTTTVDTPSGFTDLDNVNNGFLRLSDPTLSSDESEQLQELPCTVPQYHPLVRYAPANQWNSTEVHENPNTSNASCIKKPGILSKRGGERAVRSSKELDLLWEKFQQQDPSSDHESSLDSARLGHMQQLLKNPTHALVHHSLEKKEKHRLKQAKMAAYKREEQKRALLCSKIQDESSSITGSLYSNRNLSSNGIMGRDEGSISSRPSCTSDTLSSVAEGSCVGRHPVGRSGGRPEESDARLSDPIMAQLREKIDKQRKKCQQTKLRDKASEQKLQKLTHILVNRQMNDLVLATEMRRLSTTSTASMTTASETLPKSQRQNSCRNQSVVTQRKTNPVSKQQSEKYQHKDSHPPRLGQNGRTSQNATGQEMVRVQRHDGNKPKQKISRNFPNHKISENSPEVLISEQDDASDHSDFERRRPRMKDVATMVPSPKVVTDETSDEDSCQLIKASIGIQTSPPKKMLNHSRQPNIHVAKQPQPNRTTKSPPVKHLGTTTSPHKSTSVEEVQVIPVPFLSTPKRYKNLTNEAIDKASHNNVEKISVEKESDSWFISLSDQPTSNTHSSRQRQQHTQLMRPFTGNLKAKGKQNKLPPRKSPGFTKKPAGHSRGLFNHAVVPAHRSPPGSNQKMLAITNEKFNGNGIDNQTTLQDAFNNHMQCWISRSRERQKRIALAADERRYQEQMELEREEIFLNKKASGGNIIPHPFSDNLHQPKKRDLSKKEIKELNQRFYKKLPEVVQHKVLLNRATEYRTNRIRSRMFSMRVQKTLLTKTTCR